MEFGFPADPPRNLLSIGYDDPRAALLPACYDLLASEARMASFLAIANGESRNSVGSDWDEPTPWPTTCRTSLVDGHDV